MSPRKPTIDDLDDIDDEDGATEDEEPTPSDLDLTVVDAEDITGALPPEMDAEEEQEER
jgi:hypothetical protein